MKAAIYARYSTDMQSAASIEDQVRVCKERIVKEGWTPASVYADRAISGSSHLRPGYQKLLDDARRGDFDMVVAEALDRISRDQEHVAAFYKHLTFCRIKLITLAEGEISELHVGLKGTMNALFLKDLADKTRRGLRGRIEAGKSAGGLCYGYKTVKAFDAEGERIRGDREIDQNQAAVVRRIFQEFAAGRSPRAIAKRLNAERIPGPQGRTWGDTTIRGHAARLTGILRNPAYAGRLVWNRLAYRKDPTTGKRISRPNPQEAWTWQEIPALRIVEDDVWQAVQSRLKAIYDSPRIAALRKTAFWTRKRPRHLLTGVVHCGVCQGPLAAVGQDYLGCVAARRKGTCANTRSIRRDRIDAVILDSLRNRLMAPELVEVFIREYHEEINRLRAQGSLALDAARREFADTDRKLNQLIDALAEGIRSPGMKERIEALEARKDELARHLKDTPAPAPRLHPALAELYRDQVARLHQTLADPDQGHEALTILRGLIERVIVTPTAGGFEVDLHGDIAGMVELALADAANKKAAPVGAAVRDVFRSSVKVVAGIGFEPMTFRL